MPNGSTTSEKEKKLEVCRRRCWKPAPIRTEEGRVGDSRRKKQQQKKSKETKQTGPNRRNGEGKTSGEAQVEKKSGGAIVIG